MQSIQETKACGLGLEKQWVTSIVLVLVLVASFQQHTIIGHIFMYTKEYYGAQSF